MKTLLNRTRVGKMLLVLAAVSLLSACVVVPDRHYRPVYRPVYVEPHPHWRDCRC
jgi:hypothetical protein